MKIVLTIDRLVLVGMPAEAAKGALVRTATEVELTRLLSASGLPSTQGGAVPNLPPADVEWPHDVGAADAGSHIAQAVHGALTGGRRAHAGPNGGAE
jgi:hypothetical protein